MPSKRYDVLADCYRFPIVYFSEEVPQKGYETHVLQLRKRGEGWVDVGKIIEVIPTRQLGEYDFITSEPKPEQYDRIEELFCSSYCESVEGRIMKHSEKDLSSLLNS